jgi:hypothetical protein
MTKADGPMMQRIRQLARVAKFDDLDLDQLSQELFNKRLGVLTVKELGTLLRHLERISYDASIQARS